MNFDFNQLNEMIVPELQDLAKKMNITLNQNIEKQDIIYKIIDAQAISTTNQPMTENQEVKKEKKKVVKKKVVKKEETIVINDEAKEDAAIEKKLLSLFFRTTEPSIFFELLLSKYQKSLPACSINLLM